MRTGGLRPKEKPFGARWNMILYVALSSWSVAYGSRLRLRLRIEPCYCGKYKEM